ncbi:hypothetical protein KJ359_002735 [Pestalotiopsis sp. 9143b]|nr:hypothetical protein KJ359_002735 [Pestalotiopsis sp. 9143b]
MRPSHACRPCLARLRLSSSQTTRSYATLQEVVTREPDAFFARKEHDNDLADLEQEELDSDRHAAHSEGGLSRTSRGWRLRWTTPDFLRERLLQSTPNYQDSTKHISAVYGLSTAAAKDSVGQLSRLLSNRSDEETDGLYTEYEAWKLVYGRSLRQSTVLQTDTAVSRRLAVWAVLADGSIPSVSAMKASWEGLDAGKRQELWPTMVQHLLEANPALLSTFFQATHDPAWSPFYVVEDTIRLLTTRLRTAKAVDGLTYDGLFDLVYHILTLDTAGSIEIGQDVIGTIVARATQLDKIEDLFHHMRTTGKDLEAPTLLHFASRFSKSPRHKSLAADILCSMAKSGSLDVNSAAGSSVCTSLLHLHEDTVAPQEGAAPDQLFRSLLEAGLDPNLLNITALMRNFCVRGHLDTAWTVFDLLLEYGIEPDPHVYAILLHASKKDLNVESIRRLLASIHSHNVWNATMLNDFLAILLKDGEALSERRRRQKKDMGSFRPMLHVYAKFFRLEPLQKLCAFPLEEYLVWHGPAPGKSTPIRDIAMTLVAQPESSLLEPDSLTLSLMLAAALRACPKFYPPKLRNGIAALQRQSNHFVSLVQRNDATALAIIQDQGTWIYDVFLRGMLQYQQCLHPATQLVQAMLERSAAEEIQEGKNKRHPRPSVHTWTILVNGFKNHRQPGIAASMVRLMLRQGQVAPNIVTWNTLITAFARVHDAEGAVRTYRYLEHTGLKPNKYTIDAIGSMNSRARREALKLMEVSRDEIIPPDDDIVQLLADMYLPESASMKQSDPVLEQLRSEDGSIGAKVSAVMAD